MRHIYNRLYKIGTTTMASAMVAVVALGLCGCHVEIEDEMESSNETESVEEQHEIRLTYDDEDYTAYFEDCIAQYEELHSNVTISLNLVSSDDYLQTISDTSMDADQISDVYLIDNASLGTAYLAGLAQKNTLSIEKDAYCDTALEACSYDGNLIAYPLDYKTTFLAYNASYFPDSMTISSFEDIKDYSNLIYGDETVVDEDGNEIEVETETSSVDLSLYDFSSVETVFDCNLTELFMNYGFIGFGMEIGGTSGNDASNVKVCTEKAVSQSLDYLNLIAYYSLSTSRSYKSVYKRFVGGKSIFAILSTDSVAALEKKANAEDSAFSYGVFAFPDYASGNSTAPLSLTNALVVNPFSNDLETAQAFAYFATFSMANSLYKDAGKFSARENVRYESEQIGDIYASYEKSIPKNKIQYGEQIYPLIEIAMHNIIAGEDITEQLQSVDTYMATQLD